MTSPSATFEAVLYPNPALSQAGFIALMLAVGGVSTALGIAFALVGAWPVSGFLALEILLLYLAIAQGRRASARRELIRLDANGLHVRRIAPDGTTADWRFEPYWVQIQMDDPPRRNSCLTLASHGKRVVIGLFLTPEERLDLARALQAALRRYR
jgi:uncharacterized membrane protein